MLRSNCHLCGRATPGKIIQKSGKFTWVNIPRTTHTRVGRGVPAILKKIRQKITNFEVIMHYFEPIWYGLGH
jgi:hypothetical protein